MFVIMLQEGYVIEAIIISTRDRNKFIIRIKFPTSKIQDGVAGSDHLRSHLLF